LNRESDLIFGFLQRDKRPEVFQISPDSLKQGFETELEELRAERTCSLDSSLPGHLA
jgi:hypothetical protein